MLGNFLDDMARYDPIRLRMALPMEYRTKEAARRIGIAPITLKRWLLDGRVNEVARDRNGWRVFTDNDIKRIRAFASRREQPIPSATTKKRSSPS